MSKDPPKIKPSRAVRRYFSKLGKKGGHAGKGSPRVIEKMRRATEIRLAKRRLEEQKTMSTTLSEDELFKLKQRHLTHSQRALIAAELVTVKSGGVFNIDGISLDSYSAITLVDADLKPAHKEISRLKEPGNFSAG